MCEKTPRADVTVVAQGMGLDKRIGSQFPNAGLGYGRKLQPRLLGDGWLNSLDTVPRYVKPYEKGSPEPSRARLGSWCEEYG